MFAAGLYSMAEILSGILDTNLKAMEAAITDAGTVTQLIQRPDLHKKHGITPAMVTKLDLAMVLGDRVKVTDDKRSVIADSKTAAMLLTHLRNLDHEEFWIVYVDPSMKLLSVEQVSRGGMMQTAGALEIIARKAVMCGAFGVYLAHNHPCGDTTPSGADISTSKAYKQALAIMDVTVIDSIIIGSGTWTSLKNKKLLDEDPGDLLAALFGG